MNYLAHTVLAQRNMLSVTGNLLGDFCKGLDLSTLHPELQAGVINHRAVDKFTDHHPLVKQARLCFSPQRRRFAGIALDVLFDHFLILHWPRFMPFDFASYKTNLYQQLAQADAVMPETMQYTMRKLRLHDWLEQYAIEDKVYKALDNIAARIRFSHQFYGAGEDIRQHYDDLQQTFLQFFPQLQQHIRQLAIEQP